MISRKQIFVYTIVTFTGLVMAACHFDLFDSFNHPAADEPSLAGPAATNSAPVIAGTFDSSKALELLYGGYDPSTGRARWMPTPEERTLFRFTKTDNPVYTNVLMAERYDDAEGAHFVVLTRTLPSSDDCPGCNPVLGGAVFSEVGNGWNLSRETRFIMLLDPANQWQCSRIKFSETKPGAKLHWRLINNGVAEESDLLLVLNRTNFFRSLNESRLAITLRIATKSAGRGWLVGPIKVN